MQELDWYADGVKIRDANLKWGIRKVWATLYNANVAKKDMIRGDRIMEYWPLYTDRILTDAEKEIEEDKLREEYKTLSEIIRNRDNAITDSGIEHRINSGSSESGSKSS